MTAMEINRQKVELIKRLADVNDERILNDIASLIDTPPCRFTEDDLRKRVAKADADIAAGRFTAHEAIERKAV